MSKNPALTVFVLVFSLLCATSASALPLVDVGVGARYWGAAPSGDMSYKGENLDLDDNLGFDREWSPNAYARAQLPFIAVDAHFTQLDYSGKLKDYNDFGDKDKFGDINLSEITKASTDATINLLHAGAMFSLPIPMFDLGVGVGADYIDAEASIDPKDADIDKDTGSGTATLPVAKGYFNFSPPIFDINLSLAGEGVTYSGNTFYDARAKLGYVFQGFLVGDLQLEGGYRIISVDYDEEDLTLDSTFSGPFLGASLNF